MYINLLFYRAVCSNIPEQALIRNKTKSKHKVRLAHQAPTQRQTSQTRSTPKVRLVHQAPTQRQTQSSDNGDGGSDDNVSLFLLFIFSTGPLEAGNRPHPNRHRRQVIR